MATIVSDPKTVTWKAYDASALTHLLRHDSWHVDIGLPLLCGIDPENSSQYSRVALKSIVDHVNIFPDDIETDRPIYQSIALLAEDFRYNLVPKQRPDTFEIKEALQSLRNRGLELDPSDSRIKTDIASRLESRSAAHRALNECWQIFSSNPDHVMHPIRGPQYFINWAKSKCIDVPWLDWAIENGYLPLSEENGSRADMPIKIPTENLSHRAESNYLKIIAGLLDLMLTKNKLGKRGSIYGKQSAIIAEIQQRFPGESGLSERNLQEKFAAANKELPNKQKPQLR